MNSGNNRKINLIIPCVFTVALWLSLGIFFRFYYDLNDDVMIKDIISGIYTGIPDAHNNQMQYPISWIFACLYSVIPSVPWFGLFEIGCLVLSFFLIGERVVGRIDNTYHKCLYMVFQTILWLGTYLWELVMLQYTVVCGTLCIAASIWVLLTDANRAKSYWPAVALCVVAYNIRSEMFLLMCPFMAAAGICKWIRESTKKEGGQGIFCKENIIKYITIIVSIFILILVTALIDNIAYSSDEWKAYREFFDARTEVYDFTGIPDYEANEEFYSANNITYEQYDLLINYNFELDESITANTLLVISDYVKSGEAKRPDGTSMLSSSRTLKSSIGEYVRGAFRWYKKDKANISPFADDYSQLSPMNVVAIVLYVTMIAIIIFEVSWRGFISIFSLLLLRSIAWVYIYYKGRLVPRITHPMLLIEITIILILILTEVFFKNDARLSVKYLGYAVIILIVMVSVSSVPNSVRELTLKQNLRDSLNTDIVDFNKYVAEHKDEYFIVDVYSTVQYTEPVFKNEQISKANQQLAGGWVAKSPLDIIKKERYGENAIRFIAIE